MAALFRGLRALPLARTVAPARPQQFKLAARAFSISFAARSGHGPSPPQLYGPGGKAGEIPTDEEQATGAERFELISDLMGAEAFDMGPLIMTRMGTVKDPIPIFTLAPERIVGCTGYPADSHDTLYMRLEMGRQMNNLPARCKECGCVYELDYYGDPVELAEAYEDWNEDNKWLFQLNPTLDRRPQKNYLQIAVDRQLSKS